SLKQIFPVKRFFPSDWVVPGCSKWYEHSGKRDAKGDYIVALCPDGRENVTQTGLDWSNGAQTRSQTGNTNQALHRVLAPRFA
ncbi:MAG: hypothetical protein OXE52_08305, partial [Chloroflexi bacterium]|nr:hypothetical protein [Chloroflexota bacterium]